MKKTDEQLMEGREIRRCKQEERAVIKLEKQINAADKMIGSLIRKGKEVLYIFPVGGKYREGTWMDLVDFLIRNRYV